ncbi:hypothetical protein GCM10009552_28980 [Rothia nasimurium]
MFPESVKGSGSWAEVAPERMEIHHGTGELTLTDTDGEKKFFRARDW